MTDAVHTLLLVVDSLLDREQYRRYLLADPSCTYRLLEAESVASGLALCRTSAIDAIVLNYALPDGLEFLAVLKARNDSGFPPVVMVSGAGDERTAVQAIKLGAEDYLSQRYLNPEQLQTAVRSAIENARSRLQLRQSDDRFRVSIENMLDCFGIYAAVRNEAGQIIDFRIDYLNAAALSSNQMTEADLGKTLCEMFPAYRGTELFDDYCRLVETGEPLIKENLIYADIFGTERLTRAYDSRASKLGDGFVAAWRDVTDRKRTEEMIQQQLAQIEAIYKTAPVGLCFVDRDLRFVRINQQLAAINGLSVAEHLGRTLRAVLPEMADQLEPLYRQVIESGEPILNLEIQGTNRAQPGVLRHWCVCYYPQKDGQQHVVGVNTMVQEITDRKRIEANFVETTEILRSIIEGSSDVIFVKDLQGRYVVANSTAATWLETTPEMMLGQDDTDLFPPEIAQQIQQTDRQVLQTGQSISFEEEVSRQGMSRSLLSAKYPWQDAEGNILGVIGISRDISDRKQAEAEREQMQEALRQSEERLRFIADTIPHIVWATDAYGVTDYVNQQWIEYTGLSLEAAMDYGWQDLLHPDDLPQVQEFWAEACQTATLYEIEYRLRRADGAFRWHLVKGRPMRDQQGQVMKWFGTCTDIHNQKQAELDRAQLLSETEAAREEAEAANRSKDEFVAVVAHELRSPLNSIAGWAQLLRTRRLDEATIAKGLDTIYRNTHSQVQLIEDLLDISRMVRGILHINFTPLTLSDVVEAALEIVRPTAEAKQIQLETQLRKTAQISGDINRLQQIVVNLLTNAIKFTPEAGRVEVLLGQGQEQVELQIRDNGKGIAPEFLPLIFDRFAQGQRNTSSKDGLGLGLAIVKNLVELHHGTISVESPGVGQGATFTVRLPVLKAIADRAMGSEEGGILEPSALAGMRIFVVDDEPDMLELIRFVLEEYGATVQSALSAAATLDQLPQFKPDILISDIAMPNGNGYELLQQLQSLPQPDIPAIALTAYASATYEERSLQAGFQQHLTKPVETEVLVTAIVNLVRGQA